MRRTTLLALVGIGLAILSACTQEEPRIEVTEAMIARALDTARTGTMPDVADWDMEETDDGVRYAILSPGSGANAWYDDEVRVHYYLWLDDGTFVDSTRPDGVVTPFSFTVGEGRTIAGWDELVQEMNEDAEAIAIIPWELGYGRNGRGEIPGRTDLVFYVDLLSIR